MTRSKTNEAQLQQALRAYAIDLADTHTALPASLVWLRARHQAQRVARRQALARAALPLRIMQAVGLLGAVVTCAWLLHQAHVTKTAAFDATLLRWAVPAILILIAGCWTLLHTSRQPRNTNHEPLVTS